MTDYIIIILLAMIWFQGTVYSKRLTTWILEKRYQAGRFIKGTK